MYSKSQNIALLRSILVPKYKSSPLVIKQLMVITSPLPHWLDISLVPKISTEKYSVVTVWNVATPWSSTKFSESGFVPDMYPQERIPYACTWFGYTFQRKST